MADDTLKNPLSRRMPTLNAAFKRQDGQSFLRLNIGNIGRKYSGGRRGATKGQKRQKGLYDGSYPEAPEGDGSESS